MSTLTCPRSAFSASSAELMPLHELHWHRGAEKAERRITLSCTRAAKFFTLLNYSNSLNFQRIFALKVARPKGKNIP